MKLYLVMSNLEKRARSLERFLPEEDLFNLRLCYNNPYSEIYILKHYINEMERTLTDNYKNYYLIKKYTDVLQKYWYN